MKKMVDYTIVESTDRSNCISAVKRKLREGWVVEQPLIITASETGHYCRNYLQPMVMYEDSGEKE